MTAAGLVPGATLVCTGDYVVTQADADAGFVTNIASVSSADVPVAVTDQLTVPITRGPPMTFSGVSGVSIPNSFKQACTIVRKARSEPSLTLKTKVRPS